MTNGAAIGYAILAARRICSDEKAPAAIARMMYEFMDMVTEEEAEEVYQNT